MNRIRLALVQVNTVVGDLSGNVERIRNRLDEIAGCDLALFPEMTVTGYPLEDLVHKPGFVADSQAALAEVAEMSGSRRSAIMGSPTSSSVPMTRLKTSHGSPCFGVKTS